MNTFKHIRKNVFGLPQDEFSRIAGVSQTTVSKWENGILVPDYTNLLSIRSEAHARGVNWKDEWFFDTPGDGVPVEGKEVAH